MDTTESIIIGVMSAATLLKVWLVITVIMDRIKIERSS